MLQSHQLRHHSLSHDCNRIFSMELSATIQMLDCPSPFNGLVSTPLNPFLTEEEFAFVPGDDNLSFLENDCFRGLGGAFLFLEPLLRGVQSKPMASKPSIRSCDSLPFPLCKSPTPKLSLIPLNVAVAVLCLELDELFEPSLPRHFGALLSECLFKSDAVETIAAILRKRTNSLLCAGRLPKFQAFLAWPKRRSCRALLCIGRAL